MLVFYLFLALFTHFLVPSVSDELSPYGSPEKDLLLVSTLDGTLTAVRPEGPILWSIATGGPLLSSTISNLDFSKGAQWIKLIPSLGGGLYRFDGRQMKPLPLNAEALLRNSFKLFDSSLIISGGLATKTTGINLLSGEILYECSAESGCNSFKDKVEENVLVLQRRVQTVRAHEPKDGFEKWNFSVSQQQLLSLTSQESDENDRLLPSQEDPFKLKAVISDGVLCSVETTNEYQIRWRQKFDVPIVHVWRLRKGILSKVDLFSDGSLPSTREGSPSLYVGSFENQLYIQESDTLFENVNRQTSLYFESNKEDSPDHLPELPWKPYLIEGDDRKTSMEFPKLSKSDKSLEETTSLAVIYGDDVSHSRGLYLFTSDPENETSNLMDDESSPNAPIQIVFVGIWFWWKEVILISLLTVYIFNIFVTRPYVNYLRDTFAQKLALRRQNVNVVVVERRIEVPVEIHVPVEVPVSVPNNSKSTEGSSSSYKSEELTGLNSNQPYVSRFESDYIPLESLGRGGFGIVFECKNKIDDTHYAVKRIRLPRSENSKKKVMREVKVLAKLDHKNIVRYYNTWLENPPAGWQEQRDASWEGDIEFPSHTETEDTFSELSIVRNKRNVSFRPSSDDISNRNNNNCDSFSIRFDKSSSSLSDEIIFEEADDEEESSSSNSPSIEFEGNPDARLLENSSNHYSAGTKGPRSYLYIVMQLCQKESLKDWLSSPETFSLSQASRVQEAIQIFHQICLGVEYFHKMGLIHRDLKPGNIFFSKTDGTIKIGDFGLVTPIELDSEPSGDQVSSQDLHQRHTDRVGTELYMSPEQLANQSYNHKVDIYSMGLILFELLVSFSTQMERIQCLRALKNGNSSQIELAGEHFNDLVKDMISRDPDKRPEASELLSTPSLVKHAEEIAGLEHQKRRRRLLTEGSSSAGETEDALGNSL